MPNLAVVSFNSGLLSPQIDARSDVEKYSSGCRQLENMIPRVYGGATRRPGTKYIASCVDNSAASRCIPFIYSATIAYVLEFGENLIRVYYDDVLIDTVVTTYAEADLPQLYYKQSADVLWLLHPSYAPAKFTRTAVDTFSLDDIPFDNGPFIPRNDITKNDDVTIKATGYTIDTVTGTNVAGADGFTVEFATDALAAAAVAFFPINQRFYVTGATADTIDGPYTVDPDRVTTSAGTTLTINAAEAVSSDPAANGEIMVAGGEVTLTASAATFEDDHVGGLFKLTHKKLHNFASGQKTGSDTGVITDADGKGVVDVKGDWWFNTQGSWDGVIELQRMEDGTNWETYRSYYGDGSPGRNAKLGGTEESDGVQYRMNVTTHTSGKLSADFTVNQSTQDSIFRITAVASSTSATATAVVPAPDNSVTKRWAEGAWSGVRGYPTAMTFFEERAVYAGTTSDVAQAWLSETGDYENFEEGTNDADSFTLTLPEPDAVRWVEALDALVLGTSGGEWRIRSSATDAPLTPTNYSIRQQTSYGSKHLQAVKVNEAVLFVDSVGRKVREMTFVDERQKYMASDLTALAEHVTEGIIIGHAYQRNPDSILWCVLDDGALLSMVYEREQNVVAWSKHSLGGDGNVESVCVIPGTTEDEVYLTVQRVINGSTVRYIEKMMPRDWGTDRSNAFFVDAGITDEGGDTTISGLDHLEGQTVAVWADGAVFATETVVGGEITIATASTTVQVGLPYTYKLEPMRIDIATPGGTTYGSKKAVYEIMVSFFETLNAQYGDGVNTHDFGWRTTEEYGAPPALKTGDKEAVFDGGITTNIRLVISGSDPAPCTVRAILAKIEVTER